MAAAAKDFISVKRAAIAAHRAPASSANARAIGLRSRTLAASLGFLFSGDRLVPVRSDPGLFASTIPFLPPRSAQRLLLAEGFLPRAFRDAKEGIVADGLPVLFARAWRGRPDLGLGSWRIPAKKAVE